LHLSELTDAEPEEEGGECKACGEARPEYGGLSKNAPAETIDDSHNRVERVQQLPLLRNQAAAETDMGNVQAELNNKRNDVSKISIFDVERGDP